MNGNEQDIPDYLTHRMLSCQLVLADCHVRVDHFTINKRTQLSIFRDDPFYLVVIYIDSHPVIKEEFVVDYRAYAERLCRDEKFLNFLYEYANALKQEA